MQPANGGGPVCKARKTDTTKVQRTAMTPNIIGAASKPRWIRIFAANRLNMLHPDSKSVTRTFTMTSGFNADIAARRTTMRGFSSREKWDNLPAEKKSYEHVSTVPAAQTVQAVSPLRFAALRLRLRAEIE